MIRSTTTQYGRKFLDEKVNQKRRKVGLGLLKIAKEENSKNTDYIEMLDELKKF